MTMATESSQIPDLAPANLEKADVPEMHSVIWQAFTGLDRPIDQQVWQGRVQRACEAPVWEQGPAEALAVELLLEDGGDPGLQGPLPDSVDLLSDAVWALWMLAYSPEGCLDAFPPLAGTVSVWYTMTGLRGPTALAEWRARLDQMCAASLGGAADVELLATALVSDDSATVEPETVRNAVTALEVIARQPDACP